MIRSIPTVLFCGALATLWLSCTPNRRVIMPDYAGKSIPKSTLSVLKIGGTRLHVSNVDDIEDDLGTPALEALRTFVAYEMAEELKRLGTFSAVWFDTLAQGNALRSTTFKLDDKSLLTAELPETGQALIMDSASSDFTLLLTYLDISRFAGSSGTMVMGPHGTTTGTTGEAAALLWRCEYVVWDNRKGAVVSYGKLEQKTSFFIAMTAGTWSDAVTTLVRSVLEKSPFRNPAPVYKSSRTDTKAAQ